MKNVNELSAKAKREETLENVSDRISKFKGDIEHAAHDAGRNIKEYYDTKRSELNEFTDEAAATIRRKPIQSVLITAAAAFVLGRLFK